MFNLLKEREFIMKTQIKKWLTLYDITNYTINDDYTIDVDGDVFLCDPVLLEFPPFIQFGTVNGCFTCYYSKLLTLRGCPSIVKKSFNCSHNNLEDLKGAPIDVGGIFDCTLNKLSSLKGGPKKVGGDFICRNNTTKFKEEDVKKVCKVKGKIYVWNY